MQNHGLNYYFRGIGVADSEELQDFVNVGRIVTADGCAANVEK